MSRMIDALLQELEQEAQTTRRVLERVPADKLAWKPHDKSMSLGQLALHVATCPGNVAEVSRQSPFEAPDFTHPSATSAAELVPALDKSVARAREILSSMDDAELGKMWRVVAGGKEVMAIPVGADAALDHAEPLVPPPRSAVGVSQAGGRAGAVNLWPERRRESVRDGAAAGRRCLEPRSTKVTKATKVVRRTRRSFSCSSYPSRPSWFFSS